MLGLEVKHCFLKLTKTIPEDIGVGGVPHIIVCGFLEEVTVYFRADSWSSVYSWASSIIKTSKPSPSPPVEVLVLNSTLPPVSGISTLSLPVALKDSYSISASSSTLHSFSQDACEVLVLCAV